MSDDLNDEILVETDELEIQIEDDTPPEDQGRPVATADTPEIDITEEELRALESKPRVKKLVADAHAQRRRAEQAEAAAKEALRVAQEERSKRLDLVGHTARATRSSLTQEASVLAAEQRAAIEAGDAEKQIEAQQKLAKVMAQLSQIPDDEVIQRDIEAERKRGVNVQPAPPTQPALHPKTQAWMEANPWMATDETMRDAAVGAAQLLERQGIGPDSDEYYRRVDATLAAMFPDKFKKAEPVVQKKPAAPAAAPVIQRSPTTGKRSVKLTPAMLEVAEQLGVSPQDYAREYVKIQAREGAAS